VIRCVFACIYMFYFDLTLIHSIIFIHITHMHLTTHTYTPQHTHIHTHTRTCNFVCIQERGACEVKVRMFEANDLGAHTFEVEDATGGSEVGSVLS
jgi:hypothetical protein